MIPVVKITLFARAKPLGWAAGEGFDASPTCSFALLASSMLVASMNPTVNLLLDDLKVENKRSSKNLWCPADLPTHCIL
jgi:hypothetical protein